MHPASTFGSWLKQTRHAGDLTQAELGDRTGCSARTIEKLEADARRPSKRMAERLAAALGVQDAARDAFVHWARTTSAPSTLALAPQAILQPGWNVPNPPNPLIGRQREVRRARSLLERGATRLLTVVGLPGVGKTHLALQVATKLRPAFANAVVFVGLASIRDPALIPAAIAQPLGVREGGGQSLWANLQTYLHDQRLLLLLDNFEQVIAAAPMLADLLTGAPGLHILVTSRTVLHLRAEQQFPLEPLPLPELDPLPPLAVLARVPSVALFVRRAQAIQPEFRLTGGNAPAVAAICRQLEGVPLSLELAAARIKLMAPSTLATRLQQRLPLLGDGPRDLPARQQTVRAAVAWSYDLLAADGQAVFRRLGVFVGGCTLEAAAVVVEATDPPSPALVAGLTMLIDESLVRREAPLDEDPRFDMLETIREYALERLEASGETAAMHQRHISYFVTLAERVETTYATPHQRPWWDRLEREHANLRAALQWALGQGRAASNTAALRLAAALWRFWDARGYVAEGRAWLDKALTGSAEASPAIRAKALQAAGSLALSQGDCAAVRAYVEPALALRHALGDQRGMAHSLNTLGLAAWKESDYAQAQRLLEESLGLRRVLGDKPGSAMALLNLGTVACSRGDLDAAHAFFAERLLVCQELEDQPGTAAALAALGAVARDRGDYPTARVLLRESLVLDYELGQKWRIAENLEALASLVAASQPERALRLCAAAEALRRAIGVPVVPAEQGRYKQILAEARSHIDAPTAATAWAAGQNLSLPVAVAYALEEPAHEPTSGFSPSGGF